MVTIMIKITLQYWTPIPTFRNYTSANQGTLPIILCILRLVYAQLSIIRGHQALTRIIIFTKTIRILTKMSWTNMVTDSPLEVIKTLDQEKGTWIFRYKKITLLSRLEWSKNILKIIMMEVEEPKTITFMKGQQGIKRAEVGAGIISLEATNSISCNKIYNIRENISTTKFLLENQGLVHLINIVINSQSIWGRRKPHSSITITLI